MCPSLYILRFITYSEWHLLMNIYVTSIEVVLIELNDESLIKTIDTTISSVSWKISFVSFSHKRKSSVFLKNELIWLYLMNNGNVIEKRTFSQLIFYDCHLSRG